MGVSCWLYCIECFEKMQFNIREVGNQAALNHYFCSCGVVCDLDNAGHLLWSKPSEADNDRR